jgi:hypothetical protein
VENHDQIEKRSLHLRGDPSLRTFQKIVWKKGVGLVEYASGHGAHADGYRLKREVTGKKR